MAFVARPTKSHMNPFVIVKICNHSRSGIAPANLPARTKNFLYMSIFTQHEARRVLFCVLFVGKIDEKYALFYFCK